MLKFMVLIAALICSVVYMTLFWISSPKSNRIAQKIQKPFVITSALLLVLYILL